MTNEEAKEAERRTQLGPALCYTEKDLLNSKDRKDKPYTPQGVVRKINPQRKGSWDTDILQGESSVHEEGLPVTNAGT